MEKKNNSRSPVDIKEFELPETLFVSHIDTKVFQGIVLQTLSEIDGIALAQSSFITNMLGRGGPEINGAIYSEQDTRTHSVNIKIEVNICYGINIPEKAEEIQSKVSEAITRLTGLRVATIHLFFRNVIPPDQMTHTMQGLEQQLSKLAGSETPISEYNEDF